MINYRLLNSAIEYYKGKGYELIDVPWAVPLKYVQMTAPKLTKQFLLKEESYLVASAEQSFLYLHDNGKLKLNIPYMAVTPCFRDEKLIDDFHQDYFMKLELYIPLIKPEPENLRESAKLRILISDAALFFEEEGKVNVRLVNYGKGMDVEINGIEVGSYYSRTSEGLHWICGTGLALPRFEQSLNR